MIRSRTAKHLTAAAAMLAAITVGGCGSDEPPASAPSPTSAAPTTSAAPPALCTSVDALELSVRNFTTVEIERGTLAELEEILVQVQTDLTRVVDDAQEEYASEIDALEQATVSVGSSLSAALTTPSAQAITDVGAAVEALGASLTVLEDAVASTC